MKKTRLVLVLATVILCSGLPMWLHAKGTAPRMGGAAPAFKHRLQDQESPYSERVKLASDPKARRNLREAQRLIDAKDWSQAIRLLQILLDGKEDFFIEITEGESKGRRVSIRSEATRMLSTLPREGMQFYEQQFGAQARALLRQGIAANDPQIYAEVTLRYLHTDAGADAASLLGSYHLDQGQYIVAALCYERLLNRDNGAQHMTPLQLYKAALSFERAGDAKNRQRAWNLFVSKSEQFGQEPLPPLLRRMSREDLQAGLSAASDAQSQLVRDDWVMFMGSPDRAAQGVGGVPFLDAHSFDLDLNKPLISQLYHPPTRTLLEEAVKKQQSLNRPILPGLYPLAIGNHLIYRSHWGIHAYDLQHRVLCWEHPFKVSLHVLHKPGNAVDRANQFVTWKNSYLQQAPWVFFNNSLQGSLSSDQTLVYAIEDLAVPPPQPEARFGGMPRGGLATDTLSPWYQHNKLVAFELSTGRVAWEIGSSQGENDPFADTFFLGPPLPLGGKLYVLAEANREIRLLCLESRPAWLPELNREGHKVELVWSQPLCLVETPLPQEPLRRVHAAHLSYSDGLLVCPTNAGMILGVDLLTRTLLWAHPYQVDNNVVDRSFNMPLGGFRGGRARFGGAMENAGIGPLNDTVWQSAAPVLHQGYAVFTAFDADAVHCLRLRDGTHLWKQARDDEKEGRFLYLAGVFDDRVLLVGPKSCRAVNLADGKPLWTVPTGMPSGRGVASGQSYFLPLRTGEVWAIDLKSGEVVSKSKSRKGAPGNLVFHDGDVFSQSATHLRCYPQLAVAEKKITARLQADPHDPIGLAERGKIRLYRGKPQEAVVDLRAALARKTLEGGMREDTQERLYEALCDLLDKDFATHERELAALEELVPLPDLNTDDVELKNAHVAEQLERRINMFRLIANGRAAQNRMTDALAACRSAAKLEPRLLRSPDDPNTEIRPLAWAQGKVESLLSAGTAPQRQALLRTIDQEWSATRAAGTLEALRDFANFFHPICPQGRDAQLLAAEKLLSQAKLKGTGGEFEALVRLHSLAEDVDPVRAARAIDALARLTTRLGSLETAAFHYRQLAQKYPQIQVRDGKTGQEIYEDLATDKRFLPYMEDPKRSLGAAFGFTYEGKLEGLKSSSGITKFLWGEIDAEGFPFRFGIDLDRREAVLFNIHTGKELPGRFGLLQQDPLLEYVADQSQTPSPLQVTMMSGQVMLFTWGRHVYAYDPFVKRTILWTYDLLNNVTQTHPAYQSGRNLQQMMIRNGQVRLMRVVGVEEAIGSPIVVGENGVCFAVREKGLVMVDPLTGTERWVRAEVSPSAELFTDGQDVYVNIPEAEGAPARSLAFQGRDGKEIPVPPFVTQYRKRREIIGRCLLLEEKNAKDAITLYLYDVRTGKNVWTEHLPPKSVLLTSHVAGAVGAYDQDGRVRVFSLPSGRVDLQTYIPPKDLAGIEECHLLRDQGAWYLAFNRQPGENEIQVKAAPGAKGPRLAPGQTMVRSASPTLSHIFVQGTLAAFDRRTGRTLWTQSVPSQCVILDQFAENPLILAASNQATRMDVPQAQRNRQQVRGHTSSTHLLGIDKRTGEIVFQDSMQQTHTFHSLHLESHAGIVEIFSFNGNTRSKLQFSLKPRAPAEKLK